jgi:hypothetical protein
MPARKPTARQSSTQRGHSGHHVKHRPERALSIGAQNILVLAGSPKKGSKINRAFVRSVAERMHSHGFSGNSATRLTTKLSRELHKAGYVVEGYSSKQKKQ